jgi:hypothetical protein
MGVITGTERVKVMSKKRHTVESIIAKLREVDVLQSKGQTLGESVNYNIYSHH